MKLDEYYLMKPKFLASYLRARKESETTEVDTKEVSVKSLEEQYEYVFKAGEASTTINITGPLSEDGPDGFDVMRGYGGTSYANIRRAIVEASLTEGPIYLNVNSPGGTSTGLDETYQAIKKVSDTREVVVINSGLVASAAFWLASASTKMVARVETAMVGSVGVAVSTVDFSGFYSEMGIEIINLTNDASTDKRPDLTTEEGKQVIIEELNQIYSVFEKRILAFGVDREKLRAIKGAVVIADKAIELGFMSGYLNGGEKPTSKVSTDSEEAIIETDDINSTNERGAIMDLTKLKAEHPELYALVVAEATTAERERCLTFVEASNTLPKCSSIYATAIKEGKGINDASVHAAVMASATAEKEVAEASEDGAPEVVAAKPEVKESEPKAEEGTMSEVELKAATDQIKLFGGL